jgi:hypothetical protein
MSFAQARADFKRREGTMGDIAEPAFEQWATARRIEYDRFGITHSNIDAFWTVPAFVRKAPDFLCRGKRPFFCEIKGKGRAPHTKIKHQDLEQLVRWNEELEVWFFVFDNHQYRVSFTPFEEIHALSLTAPTGAWDNRITYVRIHDKHLEWESFKPTETVHGY